MRRNVVASLESLAILCTQILDQNLGSLASSSGRLTSPLTLTMLSQEGAAVIMKGEGGGGGAQPSGLPAPTGCQHHWYPDHHFASSKVCSFPAQLEQHCQTLMRYEKAPP